jgi:bilirubin oxidase
VLDDLLVDREWRLAPFDPAYAMIGRQGNVLLANGRAHPIVDLSAGGIHRFRFVNAANARYFRLALPGYRITQIGADGGKLESPMSVDELLLVPGERADVLVQAMPTAPNTVDWQTLSYDRGHGTGVLPDAPVFQVRQTDYDASKVGALPAWFEPLPELASPTVSRELRLSEGLEGSAELRGSEPHGVHDAAAEVHAMHAGASDDAVGLPGARELKFAINGVPWPDSAPLVASLGAVEEWSIVNGTEMDHPFHLHGFRFQVLSEDSQPPAARVWRDTINVRAETTTVFRVRLEEYPGRWMFHCHIQEHAERGMMGELLVEVTD